MKPLSKTIIAERFQTIQNRICSALEVSDGQATFEEDAWNRKGGGGGITRIIRHGNLLEKGGVNFSAVHGTIPEFLKKEGRNEANEFFASGVSIVIHPYRPTMPIIHMNIRYFEMDDGTWWFGGGIDLTPIYVDKEQTTWFHQQIRSVCDRFDPAYYPRFKTWADDYFYIKHRKETRGVGGIFFDHLQADETHDKQGLFDFVTAVGESFVPIYTALLDRNREKTFNEKEKEWQMVRRGRYVEFNLMYDRGTRFGLETDGRIESILMSLPEQAGWFYNYESTPGSPEAETLSFLKKGVDWV